MADLITTPNLQAPDEVYAALIAAHDVEAIVRVQATVRDLATDEVLWSQTGLIFKEQYEVPQGEDFLAEENIALDQIARGVAQALREVGKEDANNAEFVVVGEGPGLDYASLTRGLNLIVNQGARLVATNPDSNVDATVEGEHRLVPGGGALVAPFAVASGVEPVIIGKPNPLLFEMALELLGCPPEHCLMIGDRPDTDIAGAARLGMRTALVRTGRFAPGTSSPSVHTTC